MHAGSAAAVDKSRCEQGAVFSFLAEGLGLLGGLGTAGAMVVSGLELAARSGVPQLSKTHTTLELASSGSIYTKYASFESGVV